MLGRCLILCACSCWLFGQSSDRVRFRSGNLSSRPDIEDRLALSYWRLGSQGFNPSIALEDVGYESNPTLEPNGLEQADETATLKAQLDWLARASSRLFAEGRGSISQEEYSDTHHLSGERGDLRLDGYALFRRSFFRLQTAYEKSRRNPTSEVNDRPLIERRSASLLYQSQLGTSWLLEGELLGYELNHEKGSSAALLDQQTHGARTVLLLQSGKRFWPFLELHHHDLSFTNPAAIRESRQQLAFLGMRNDFSSRSHFNLKLGRTWLDHQLEEGHLKDQSTSVEAYVSSNFSRRFKGEIGHVRQSLHSVITLTHYDSRRFLIGMRFQLSPAAYLAGDVWWGSNAYPQAETGTRQSDDLRSATLSLNWTARKAWAFRLGGEYNRRESEDPGLSASQYRLLAEARWKP